jgi:pimeloyl-ACP methyl ester carboxylesterase
MTAIADGHDPVAIDLPGHGQSPGSGFRGVGDYTYFAVELTKALGWDRFVIAGHSLGGAIALLTALHHGELLDGLILVDTGARLRVDQGASPRSARGRRGGAAACEVSRPGVCVRLALAAPRRLVSHQSQRFRKISKARAGRLLSLRVSCGVRPGMKYAVPMRSTTRP